MVAIGMSHSQRSGSQGTGRFGKDGGCRQGGTWDFQQNLRRWRQGAAQRYQGTARTHIQSGRELKEILTVIVLAADEYRDG